EAVAAAERGEATVLQPAQPALGRCPDCAIGGHADLIDPTLAEPVASRVRSGDPAVGEVGQTARKGADPYSTAHRVGREPPRKRALVLPLRIDAAIRGYAQQADFAVREPQIPVVVLGEGIDVAGGHRRNRAVGAISDIAEPGVRSDPDTAAAILEERGPGCPGQPADLNFRQATAVPASQAGHRTDPHAAIAGGEHGSWSRDA